MYERLAEGRTPLPSLQAYAERGREASVGVRGAFSLTLEPYISIAVSGPTVEAAEEGWKAAFDAYAAGNGPRIIWRLPPSVVVEPDHADRYFVKARLLVTARPDVAATEAEARAYERKLFASPFDRVVLTGVKANG